MGGLRDHSCKEPAEVLTKLSSRLLRLVVCVATVIVAGVWLQERGSAWVDGLAIRLYGTPHRRYGAALKRHGFADTRAARLWLDSAAQALAAPATVKLPHRRSLEFTGDDPKAAAFAVSVRRGQRYVAEARVDNGDSTAVFLDVFERDGDNLRHVASAAPVHNGIAVARCHVQGLSRPRRGRREPTRPTLCDEIKPPNWRARPVVEKLVQPVCWILERQQ